MARKSEAKLTATIQGQNKVSGPMKEAASDLGAMTNAVVQSETKIANAYKKTDAVTKQSAAATQQFGAAAGQAAGGFGKSAGALNLMAAGMGKSGGATADATAKIADLIGLAGTGGPLGIGIAALTALVALGAYAWSEYSEEEEAAAKAAEEHTEVIKEQKKELAALRGELIDFGKDSAQVSRETAARDLTELERKERMAQTAHDSITAELDAAKIRFGAVKQMTSTEIELTEKQTNAALELKKARALTAISREDLSAIDEKARLVEQAASAEAATQKGLEKLKDISDKRDRSRAKWQAKRAEERAKQAALIASGIKFETELEKERADTRAAQIAENMQAEMDYIRTISAARLEEQKKKEDDFKRDKANAMALAEERAKQYFRTGEAYGALAASIATGERSTGDLVKQMALQSVDVVRDAAIKKISASAAVAAGGAAESQAAIPIVGPALAAVAAGVMFAAVKYYISTFHTGGVVGDSQTQPGLKPGEQFILAEKGEGILSKDTRAKVNKELGLAQGADITATGGASQTVIFNSVLPAQPGQMQATARTISTEQRRLRQRGM